jgi:hypothetical protein
MNIKIIHAQNYIPMIIYWLETMKTCMTTMLYELLIFFGGIFIGQEYKNFPNVKETFYKIKKSL